MRQVYLDYNSTTPIHPEVREAMLPFLGENFGNPSSLHWAGRRAKKALEEAREKVACALSCEAREIIFTSGGTESINLALRGVMDRPGHVISTRVEHQAVLKTLEKLASTGDVEVTLLDVDSEGNIDLKELEEAIRKNTVLVSVMWVNNEIGNVYPVEEIGTLVRSRGILFHVDAVQAVGKIPVCLHSLPIDLLSFSSHKIYGPAGVGGLFVRRGVKIASLLHGGAQELEKRSGTENLSGIVGLGCAIEGVYEKQDQERQRLTELRELLEKGLRQIDRVRIYGNPAQRVCNTLQCSFEGIENETILVALDREGIAVSSGSACASGAVEPSHVLMAMGVDRIEAKGAVRFSFGRETTMNDIQYTLEKLPKIVEELR